MQDSPNFSQTHPIPNRPTQHCTDSSNLSQTHSNSHILTQPLKGQHTFHRLAQSLKSKYAYEGKVALLEPLLHLLKLLGKSVLELALAGGKRVFEDLNTKTMVDTVCCLQQSAHFLVKMKTVDAFSLSELK